MKKKGFVLIVAIFIVILFAIVGVVAASLISGDSVVIIKDLKGLQALNLAEAGVHYALTSDLSSDSDWSDNIGFSKSFGGGLFTVSYEAQSADSLKIKSLGIVSGVTRVIVVDLNRSSGSSASYDVAFTHALYASNPSGTLYIENDAHVVGDLYYNGDVVMKNNALVIDGVLYSDSLDCRNNSRAVSAEASEPQMPEFDSSSYDETLSEINQTATTALVVQNNDSFTMNGGIYYFTSVTLKNNAKIEGSGTIVATDGDISIQNNTTFSDDNVTLIAQGDVNLDNNTNFKEDFKIYAHGDINVRNNSDILAEALFYTDTGDIIFNNNGHFDGVILAPQGDISCQNNTIINGLIYGDYFEAKNNTHVNGSIVVNDVGMLSNQVIITYDPLQLPIETPMGIGSQESSAGGLSHSISNWYEFFD